MLPRMSVMGRAPLTPRSGWHCRSFFSPLLNVFILGSRRYSPFELLQLELRYFCKGSSDRHHSLSRSKNDFDCDDTNKQNDLDRKDSPLLKVMYPLQETEPSCENPSNTARYGHGGTHLSKKNVDLSQHGRLLMRPVQYISDSDVINSRIQSLLQRQIGKRKLRSAISAIGSVGVSDAVDSSLTRRDVISTQAPDMQVDFRGLAGRATNRRHVYAPPTAVSDNLAAGNILFKIDERRRRRYHIGTALLRVPIVARLSFTPDFKARQSIIDIARRFRAAAAAAAALESPTAVAARLATRRAQQQAKLLMTSARCAALRRAHSLVAYMAEARRENVFTLPNLLSLSRITATPLLGYWVVVGNYSMALVLFIYAAASDVADGVIARQWPTQRSAAGSVLDPLADKVLVGALFGSLTYAGLIPLPLTALIVARDSGLMLAACYLRFASLPPPRTLKRYFDPSLASLTFAPTVLSKANTAVQLAFVGFSLAAPVFGIATMTGSHPLLVTLGCIAAVTTVASALDYAIRHKTGECYRFITPSKAWSNIDDLHKTKAFNKIVFPVDVNSSSSSTSCNQDKVRELRTVKRAYSRIAEVKAAKNPIKRN